MSHYFIKCPGCNQEINGKIILYKKLIAEKYAKFPELQDQTAINAKISDEFYSNADIAEKLRLPKDRYCCHKTLLGTNNVLDLIN